MLYTMREKLGKWGFVNENGEPICEFIYDEVRSFSEGLAAVRVNDKWGYINKDGAEICEIRYDAVGDFQSKLGVVEKEGKKCYLNTNGEEVAVTNFMNEEMFFEGCKSCAIGNHTITNLPGGYLYEDEFINVTIDPEIPIRGFIVIGINKHVSTTTQLTREERIQIEDITNKVKLALEHFGAKNILLFEDGFSQHYRRWVIPSDDWMFQFGRGKNLKQITMYAKKNMSDEQKKEILLFAEQIKVFLRSN